MTTDLSSVAATISDYAQRLAALDRRIKNQLQFLDGLIEVLDEPGSTLSDGIRYTLEYEAQKTETVLVSLESERRSGAREAAEAIVAAFRRHVIVAEPVLELRVR